ncbi:MAG: hypothetical protein A2840_01265 [Candidatus Buchananbacteria bacterium RIFCSPHIGHO2_01_FULL_47_11b]|uniref:UDP-N-acetylmuramoyl-tripeptide--D-alanyl-D-alanine ligase n=1 Tax=Candidatus Buchananbacteria bacterium RIFCSPHIGHO2_01_FULL_47_11b TaxID=1797537 RepID=A0A1G1Y7B2_9BACT|nr:MAG: hypothetical protein A2840_01265 [Candidatus Buchananbacteria bacterium RIFCSPHIGHO2_01_FULL_47_11b]
MLKKIIQLMLRWCAIRILRKYQPRVVAVTGSVGKTSTVQAIYAVVEGSFSVRKNLKNYNNEFGIPLSIIGAEAGRRSPIRWLGIFLQALSLILVRSRSYPQLLVLEMGADHPGDIKYLTSFVPIDVAVVTNVAPAHTEYFKSIEGVAKEKGTVVSAVKKNGFSVLNSDDDWVVAMRQRGKGSIVMFGLQPTADVRASSIAISHDVEYQDISTIQGISFKLHYQGSTTPVLLPRVLGEHLVYTALAAAAVGLVLGVNPHTIADRLKQFEPPKGRMHVITGIKQTLIIDDSYNSSPLAARKALYQLQKISVVPGAKKYAVLGDMRELGSYTEAAHREIGQAAFEYGADCLVTVGEIARDIIRGAVEQGMSLEQCFSFMDSESAGRFLQDRIRSGDVLLVKGSQAVRMEKIVKELMAEPQRAAELLVRQDEGW